MFSCLSVCVSQSWLVAHFHAYGLPCKVLYFIVVLAVTVACVMSSPLYTSIIHPHINSASIFLKFFSLIEGKIFCLHEALFFAHDFIYVNNHYVLFIFWLAWSNENNSQLSLQPVLNTYYNSMNCMVLSFCLFVCVLTCYRRKQNTSKTAINAPRIDFYLWRICLYALFSFRLISRIFA